MTRFPITVLGRLRSCFQHLSLGHFIFKISEEIELLAVVELTEEELELRLKGEKIFGPEVDHLAQVNPGQDLVILNKKNSNLKGPSTPKAKAIDPNRLDEELTKNRAIYNIPTYGGEEVDWGSRISDAYGRLFGKIKEAGSRLIDALIGDKLRNNPVLAFGGAAAAAIAAFAGWKTLKFTASKLIGGFVYPFKKAAKFVMGPTAAEIGKGASRGLLRSGALKVLKFGRFLSLNPIGLAVTAVGAAGIWAFNKAVNRGEDKTEAASSAASDTMNLLGKTPDALRKIPEIVESENPFNKGLEDIEDRLPGINDREFSVARKTTFSNLKKGQALGLYDEIRLARGDIDIPDIPQTDDLEEFYAKQKKSVIDGD